MLSQHRNGHVPLPPFPSPRAFIAPLSAAANALPMLFSLLLEMQGPDAGVTGRVLKRAGDASQRTMVPEAAHTISQPSSSPRRRWGSTQNVPSSCATIAEHLSPQQLSAAPHRFFCPISLDIMADPVLLSQTGQTYDYPSLITWFESGKSWYPDVLRPRACISLPADCQGCQRITEHPLVRVVAQHAFDVAALPCMQAAGRAP